MAPYSNTSEGKKMLETLGVNMLPVFTGNHMQSPGLTALNYKTAEQASKPLDWAEYLRKMRGLPYQTDPTRINALQRMAQMSTANTVNAGLISNLKNYQEMINNMVYALGSQGRKAEKSIDPGSAAGDALTKVGGAMTGFGAGMMV